MSINRFYIQTQIHSLSAQKQNFKWLIDLEIQACTVANFGCSIGIETLALMWALGANEGVGLDKDELAINQALSTLRNIREDITRITRLISYYAQRISEEEKRWWQFEVPQFIRDDMARENFKVNYLFQDITEPTKLQSDYYDLAYCDFVLHHIWYDNIGTGGRNDTKFAIGEMARVIKSSGVIAITELLQHSDKPKLDFRTLFEECGLNIVFENAVETNQGLYANYLCKKISKIIN